MQRKQEIKTQEERVQEAESCWSPRGYRDNEQRVASEHVTATLSVAVENTSGGKVEPTLLMWTAKELLDQEGSGL